MLTGCANAVVTTGTTPDDAKMIKVDGKPRVRIVAGAALVASRWMIWRLAFVLDVIVASRAAAENRIVVHSCERKPGRSLMAVFAKISTCDMICWFRAGTNAAADRMTGVTV